eukprot:gnl/Dysnectes_brevis/3748_a4812_1012.p1 GENE.gnl/Dysnectes_brevis/3748_a4812_1012~~gnl/Dysnectes_brevis/3748_a4812_1012.p1  ORF type:complete len:232 (+),score=57.24 gnl/Dysnectes_brevis/3748_a4812_1012:142-837(+)
MSSKLSSGIAKTYVCCIRGLSCILKQFNSATIREIFEELGFINISSYLQAANVVAMTNEQVNESVLSARIVEALSRRSPEHCELSAFVFTLEDFERIVESNPYADKGAVKQDPFLYTLFVNDKITPEQEAIISDPARFGSPPERFVMEPVTRRAVYIQYTTTAVRSRFNISFWEQQLHCSCISRSSKTLHMLLKKGLKLRTTHQWRNGDLDATVVPVIHKGTTRQRKHRKK